MISATKKIIIVLLVLATFLLAIRFIYNQFYTSTDSVWVFNIELDLTAKKFETLIKFSPPDTTSHARVVRQSLSHPNATLRFSKGKFDGKTILTFTPDKNGQINIGAEFLIHITEYPRINIKSTPLATDAKQKYLSDSPQLDIYSQDITDFAEKLSKNIETKNELLDAIYRYARTFTAYRQAKNTQIRPASELLGQKKISIIEQANLFVALARTVKIPARLVTGFILRESPKIQPHHWVEVYLDREWQALELYNGYKAGLPSTYIPFRYDNNDIISVIDGSDLEVNYSLVETRYAYIQDIGSNRHFLSIFNLNRLSQDLRNTLAALLLLPFGILITVIFRHFIGVHNYGVFAPSLLSLALTRNDFTITIITISLVMLIVIGGRMGFPRKMNRTPRLAIIFTLVIIGMAIAISFIDFYLPSPEGIAVLLPVVIIASLTDSFYKTLDTSGKHTAYIRLFWTAVITLFCIPILSWDALGHQVVLFPEIHLITLAGILIITSYKSKQLVKYIPKFLKEKPSAKPESDTTD